jgi:hypothetical protein
MVPQKGAAVPSWWNRFELSTESECRSKSELSMSCQTVSVGLYIINILGGTVVIHFLSANRRSKSSLLQLDWFASWRCCYLRGNCDVLVLLSTIYHDLHHHNNNCFIPFRVHTQDMLAHASILHDIVSRWLHAAFWFWRYVFLSGVPCRHHYSSFRDLFFACADAKYVIVLLLMLLITSTLIDIKCRVKLEAIQCSWTDWPFAPCWSLPICKCHVYNTMSAHQARCGSSLPPRIIR